MSYRCQVINVAEANQAAVLSAIGTELQNMGWEVHDASYGVYKSAGEAGTELTQYIRVYSSSSTVLYIVAYYYWNATTHAGIGKCYSQGLVMTSESGCYLWMMGNANLATVMTKVGSTYYNVSFGFPNKRQLTVNTTLTSAASSGSNVQLTVASTTGFVAGHVYQIVGAAREGRDTLTVNTVNDATHVTVASLPRNYGSGALFGQTPCIFGVLTFNNFFLTCHGYASSTTDCGYFAPAPYAPYLMADNKVQDWRLGYDMLMPVLLGDTNTSYNYRYSFMSYIDEYLLIGSRCAAVEDVMAVGKQTSGSATSATNTTIVNSGASWTVDAYIGKCVIITSGTGLGQVRKITDNDGTSLTVDRAWDTNPVSGSAYMVADEAYMGINATYLYYCRVGC